MKQKKLLKFTKEEFDEICPALYVINQEAKVYRDLSNLLWTALFKKKNPKKKLDDLLIANDLPFRLHQDFHLHPKLGYSLFKYNSQELKKKVRQYHNNYSKTLKVVANWKNFYSKLLLAFKKRKNTLHLFKKIIIDSIENKEFLGWRRFYKSKDAHICAKCYKINDYIFHDCFIELNDADFNNIPKNQYLGTVKNIDSAELDPTLSKGLTFNEAKAILRKYFGKSLKFNDWTDWKWIRSKK